MESERVVQGQPVAKPRSPEFLVLVHCAALALEWAFDLLKALAPRASGPEFIGRHLCKPDDSGLSDSLRYALPGVWRACARSLFSFFVAFLIFFAS